MLLAVLSLIAVVCQASVSDSLVWDDRHFAEPEEQQPAGMETWAADFSRSFWGVDSKLGRWDFYRPVTNLSFRLDNRLWKGEARGLHLTNLLLHLGVCAALFGVARRLRIGKISAAFAALIFGVSPRLGESVFWISGRTDVIASLFVLLALFCHLKRPERQTSCIIGAVFLGLGLLAKEVAIAGVVAITVLELGNAIRHRGSARAALLRITPAWVATLVYMGLRTIALPLAGRDGAPRPLVDATVFVAERIGQYSLMFLDPLHPALRIGSIAAPRNHGIALLGSIVALAMAWTITRLWRTVRGPELLALLSLPIIGIGLVVGILPIDLDVVAADRFLYLPLSGFILAAALASTRLESDWKKRVAASLCIGCILLFSLHTRASAVRWSDELRLWHASLANADPHDSQPHFWVGKLLLERDEPEAALAHFEAALQVEMLLPSDRRSQRNVTLNLSMASESLTALGRDIDALHAIDQACEIEPDNPLWGIERAETYARLLRFEEARSEVARVLSLTRADDSHRARADRIAELHARWRRLPARTEGEDPSVQFERARILMALGAQRAAESIARSVLAREVLDDKDLYQLTRMLVFQMDTELAQKALKRLQRQPGAHRADAEVLAGVLARRDHELKPLPIPVGLLEETTAMVAPRQAATP